MQCKLWSLTDMLLLRKVSVMVKDVLAQASFELRVLDQDDISMQMTPYIHLWCLSSGVLSYQATPLHSSPDSLLM